MMNRGWKKCYNRICRDEHEVEDNNRVRETEGDGKSARVRPREDLQELINSLTLRIDSNQHTLRPKYLNDLLHHLCNHCHLPNLSIGLSLCYR